MLEGKTFSPCHRLVLVKMDERTETSFGGIIIPEVSRRAEEWGKAMAIGPEVVNVKEDDEVFVPRIDGMHIIVGGVEYLLVDERKILLLKGK